jgi:hypothetical protein
LWVFVGVLNRSFFTCRDNETFVLSPVSEEMKSEVIGHF